MSALRHGTSDRVNRARLSREDILERMPLGPLWRRPDDHAYERRACANVEA